MSLGSIRIGSRYSKRNRLDNRVELEVEGPTLQEINEAESRAWQQYWKDMERHIYWHELEMFEMAEADAAAQIEQAELWLFHCQEIEETIAEKSEEQQLNDELSEFVSMSSELIFM